MTVPISASPAYVDYITDEPPPPAPSKKKKKPTKAELKARKLKAEQEFRKLEITEHLKRELELSRKSSLRGRQKWQEMCREIKIVQMREELQAWEAQTNRLLSQKDEKISLLLDDIKETDEMHKRTFGKQLQFMDYLTDIFQVFKDSARLRYEAQASEMLHNFYAATSERDEFMNDFQRKSENVLHSKNQILGHTIREDYDTFLDKRNDCVNTEIIKRYHLRDSIVLKMNDLQKLLLQFLATMRNTSLDAGKYERANALMERQRTFVIESQKLNDSEARGGRLHQDLQRELERVGAEGQRKINDLKLEHSYFVDQRKSIEQQMKLDRERTHEKLKILTTQCFGICKKYRKLQTYGELLLSLSANCRKLQTEAEKIVPSGDSQTFKSDLATNAEDFVIQVLDLKSHVDLSEDEMKAQMDLMNIFWHRQAVAEAQNVVLEGKKRQLTKENQHYKDIIRSLSKADNVNELQEALRIQCVLDEEPRCAALDSLHL